MSTTHEHHPIAPPPYHPRAAPCCQVPPLAPLLFCGAALGDELSPEGGTRLTLDGWMQVDVSERAAAVVLEARKQTNPNPTSTPTPTPTPTLT